jgi:hypothetical protein
MGQQPRVVKPADERTGPFARIEEAIAAMREGKMMIVVDDEDRETKAI